MSDKKSCRESLPHIKPCGPTPNSMFCACGCGGDDTWCYSERIAALEEALSRCLYELDHAYNGADNFAILTKAHARATLNPDQPETAKCSTCSGAGFYAGPSGHQVICECNSVSR